MDGTKNLWESRLLHPVLFGVYPLLALWVTNISQIPAYALLRSVIMVIVFILASLGAGRLLFRDRNKAAVFASLLLVLFMTYGHLFALVDAKSVGGFFYGRHRYFIPLWVGLLGLGALLLWRMKGSPHQLNRILNIVSVFLVGFSLAQALIFTARSLLFARQEVEAATTRPGAPSESIDGPDVYYILLDGYSREDVMQRLGGPDISGFLNELAGLGFTVDRCALDNYDSTVPSMTSALNMDYIDALGIETHWGEPEFKYEEFEPQLKNSRVRRAFESFGYQFITFKTVYDWLDITDSDIFYDLEETVGLFDRQAMVDFHTLFLSTTWMRPLMETEFRDPSLSTWLPTVVRKLVFPGSQVFNSREYKQYQRSLYNLEKLRQVPLLEGKKFVYAHLFITHQPYVFQPDGSFVWPPKEDLEGYFAQVEYINSVLPEILREIIAGSDRPPVIIVQSDHGYPDTPDRARILNAYYLPGAPEGAVYPGITPVNSFRVVLNTYFNGSYPLLPDQTFHSPRDWPYRFEPVTPSCAD